MHKLNFILFTVMIGICCFFTSLNAQAAETFFLPKVGCQFLIPDGYKKSDSTTHDRLEFFRRSLYPKSLSDSEKRRRAKIEAVFHKTLDDVLLPTRPFFTMQIRDIGREIKERDIEAQISTFKKIKTNPVEVYEKMKINDFLNYLITKEMIVDRKNNSIIMMYQSKISGDEKDIYIIQFFKFYRNGLLVFNFYSDTDDLITNIDDFYLVINSFKLGRSFAPNIIH